MAKRKRRNKSAAPTDARPEIAAPPASSELLQPYGRSDWIALGAFFASGFVALVYEICWIRKSAVAFGTASFALSTVLAVFFGGLSLGSFLFGRRAVRYQRPLRVYAFLEVGISVWALLTPWLFSGLDLVYGIFFRLSEHSFVVLTVVRVVLVVIAILPATVLMGASLPIFCRHFVTSSRRVSAPIGLLYAVNTLGAAIGCALCGFMLIPMIGINASLGLGVAINLAMAGLMFRVSQGVPPLPVPDGPGSTPRSQHGGKEEKDANSTWLYWVFFGTGFVALGYEVLWSRYLSLLILNNVYNHTLTITVILLGIVLGSMISSRLGDRTNRRALFFALLQICSGLIVMVVLLLPPDIWGVITPHDLSVTGLVCLLVLLPPAILSGASFPLAMAMAVDRAEVASSRVGLMTAMNTVGGIVGSLLVGFLFLPFVGLQGSLSLMTGCSILVGVASLWLFDKTLSRNGTAGVILATALIWILLPRVLTTRLPHDFLAQGRQLVEVSEGIGVNMAVLLDEQSKAKELQINRLWQGQDRKNHQIMAAHIPTLIHTNPKSVLMVGVGCGQTASRFLMHNEVESLECVEIEGGLIDLIGRHFPAAWMKDARTRIVVEDGRNYLAHTAKQYDIISLEVGQVFRPGVAGFYTLEFYRSARRRLLSGGFLCQFVPMDSLSRGDFKTVVKTFLEVFPQSTLWFNRAELLLIGANSDEVKLSLAALGRLSKAAHADMAFAYWAGDTYAVRNPAVFLANFLAGPGKLLEFSNEGDIYRDDRPWLEYRTASKSSHQLANAADLEPFLSDPADVFVDADQQLVRKAKEIRKLNLVSWRAQAIIEQGVKAASQQDLDAAMRHFHAAVEMLPQHVVAQLNLSQGYMMQADYRLAEEHARTALRLDPHSADVHFMISQVLKARNKESEARKHFQRYQELIPRSLW